MCTRCGARAREASGEEDVFLGERDGQDALRGSAGPGEPARPGTRSVFLQGEPSAGSIPTGLCAPLGSQRGEGCQLSRGSQLFPCQSPALWF